MRIQYETWHGEKGFPPERFANAVRLACEADGTRRLLEVGGGANPILSLDEVRDRGLTDYVVTDVSAEELDKAPDGYKKVLADITSAPLHLGEFDLVVSRTVAEHLNSPAAFHAAVFELLAPGGRAMHYFPTLYEPAFVANLLLPDAVSGSILQRIQPHRASDGKHGKFHAYYRWCRGPTERQLARLQRVGYEVDEYVAVFGHDYYQSLPVLNRLQTGVSQWLSRHPVAGLTAYCWVTLRRPAAAARAAAATSAAQTPRRDGSAE